MVSKTDENGNLGRHFVSCLSIPMMGRDGKVRSQFVPRNVVIFCSDLSKLHFFSSNLRSRFMLLLQILKKCSHFEWIDQYVDRLESEGHIDMSDAATRDLILPPFAVERPNFSGGRGAPAERPMPTARITRIAERAAFAELPVEAEVNQELKKVKKLLRQMVDLQKQANLVAIAFYSCFIALFFLYHLFIHR